MDGHIGSNHSNERPTNQVAVLRILYEACEAHHMVEQEEVGCFVHHFKIEHFLFIERPIKAQVGDADQSCKERSRDLEPKVFLSIDAG